MMICKRHLKWSTVFKNGKGTPKDTVQLLVHHSTDYRKKVSYPSHFPTKQMNLANRSKRKNEKGIRSGVIIQSVQWYWIKWAGLTIVSKCNSKLNIYRCLNINLLLKFKQHNSFIMKRIIDLHCLNFEI